MHATRRRCPTFCWAQVKPGVGTSLQGSAARGPRRPSEAIGNSSATIRWTALICGAGRAIRA
jgi:hypothetical protein